MGYPPAGSADAKVTVSREVGRKSTVVVLMCVPSIGIPKPLPKHNISNNATGVSTRGAQMGVVAVD
jgi:hypothetical protein